MLSFSADEYESKKNRETSGQQRLTALLDAPGGRDDLEEEDEEDTEPTVARADDIDAELTVSEIMDLEPKKMVMNSSEKIMNRYYEGALGPVENVTAFFETSKVGKTKKNHDKSHDAKQREATRSNAKQREATRSNAKQREATRSNAKQREATRSNAKQREATRSNAKQREATRSNAKQREADAKQRDSNAKQRDSEHANAMTAS